MISVNDTSNVNIYGTSCFSPEEDSSYSMLNVTILCNNNSAIPNPIDFCFTPYCVPYAIAITIISVCGIIANVTAMIVVTFDKRLHQPTFVSIAALALPDVTFLIARYIRYVIDGYFVTSMSRMEYRITKMLFDFIGLVGGGASVFHVMLLSVLRYFIVVHPLKTHVVLSNKKVVLISFLLWIAATVNGALYLYAVIINTKDKDLQRTYNKVITIFMTMFPVLVIGILHTIKARALLKSLSTTEKTIRKMSRVITFIICSYIITTSPSNLLDLARYVLPVEQIQTKLFYTLQQVGRVLLFLNYAINPFIYFVYSPQFKRFFLEHWSRARCAPKGSSRHKWTSDTEGLTGTRLTDLTSPRSSSKHIVVV